MIQIGNERRAAQPACLGRQVTQQFGQRRLPAGLTAEIEGAGHFDPPLLAGLGIAPHLAHVATPVPEPGARDDAAGRVLQHVEIGAAVGLRQIPLPLTPVAAVQGQREADRVIGPIEVETGVRAVDQFGAARVVGFGGDADPVRRRRVGARQVGGADDLLRPVALALELHRFQEAGDVGVADAHVHHLPDGRLLQRPRRPAPHQVAQALPAAVAAHSEALREVHAGGLALDQGVERGPDRAGQQLAVVFNHADAGAGLQPELRQRIGPALDGHLPVADLLRTVRPEVAERVHVVLGEFARPIRAVAQPLKDADGAVDMEEHGLARRRLQPAVEPGARRRHRDGALDQAVRPALGLGRRRQCLNVAHPTLPVSA
ncbi:MAG TPA: hypothetical protein VGL58_16500 [Caulobacteraceae bacterium]